MNKPHGCLIGQESQSDSPTALKTCSKLSNTNEYKRLPFGAIYEIADRAGIELKGRHPKKKQIRCVFPESHKNGDHNPSAFLNGELNCFHCKGCGKSLSLKNFAAHLDVSSSVNITSNEYFSDESDPEDYTQEIIELWAESKKQILDMPHNKPILDFLVRRGYDIPSLIKCGIMRILPLSYDFPDCWFFKGMERYRIALLTFDKNGEIFSFQARNYITEGPLANPRFRYPTGFTGSGYFMNRAAHAWVKNPRKISTVFVMEGMTDSMRMASDEETPMIGMTGGNEKKIHELPWHLTDSLVDFTDPDSTGNRYSDSLKNLPTKIIKGADIWG